MALTDDQLSKISDAIWAGNKIAAIKIYREATGLGLAEAKTEIERIQAGLAKEHPEISQAQKKGCAAVLLLGLFLTYTLAALVATSFSNAVWNQYPPHHIAEYSLCHQQRRPPSAHFPGYA